MSTSRSGKQAGFKLYSVMILIGTAPVLMVIIPWDFGPDMNPYRGFMRGHSLTVPLIEMVVILLAMARGFSPFAAISDLPRLTKVGATLFLGLAIWGAAFIADIPIFALLGISKLVIHALFFLAVRNMFESISDIWKDRVWAAIGGGVFGYCLLWGTNILIFHPAEDDWMTRVPGLTNPRGAGFFALAGFFAGFAMLPQQGATGKARWQGFCALLVSTIALGLALWTGSRGGVIAILVGTVIVIIIAPARQRLLSFVLAVAVLAISANYPLPSVHPSYGMERILNRSLPASNNDDLSSGRTQMWINTADKIGQRPLMGWGIDQFSRRGPTVTLGFKQPHNMVLQLLFSTGLLGAIAACFIIIPMALTQRPERSKPYQRAAWGYISGLLIFGLYDAAFYYPFPVMIFLISIACISKPILPTPATDMSGLRGRKV